MSAPRNLYHRGHDNAEELFFRHDDKTKKRYSGFQPLNEQQRNLHDNVKLRLIEAFDKGKFREDEYWVETGRNNIVGISSNGEVTVAYQVDWWNLEENGDLDLEVANELLKIPVGDIVVSYFEENGQESIFLYHPEEWYEHYDEFLRVAIIRFLKGEQLYDLDPEDIGM